MSTRFLTRAGIAGTTSLIALALAAPAHAATEPAPSAASYLATELAAGQDVLSASGYTDLGLTIDAVLGMSATGTAGAQAQKSAAAVEARAGEYHGTGGETYAGSLAKYIVLQEAQGKPVDALVAELKGLQTGEGRFSDKSQYGDYSNAIGQSWALIALKRAGESIPAAAADYLVAQQCTDGGFRLSPGEACESDPDVTSFAVQALVGAGRTEAAAKGANYLATKQGANGGLSGGTSTPEINANSTGLAAVAFRLTGKAANAARAVDFVKSLQVPCDAPEAVRGAIAYDAASLAEAKSSGTAGDKFNRTTAQAVFALTDVSYLDVTFGGEQAAAQRACPADDDTPPVTDDPTDAPSSPSGPAVVTDGPHTTGDNRTVALVGGGAALALLASGGAVLAVGRRR